MRSKYTDALSWNLDSIPFERIEAKRIRDNEGLFFLLAAGSFIEIASDAYAHNLAKYFAEDEEVSSWLIDHWEREEVQHGLALKTYVLQVWPEFDWNAAYKDFFAEFTRDCPSEMLEPIRGLEMVARCVVEMGTATLYRAIHNYTDEPVLKLLIDRIKRDELRHYKHFYRYFTKYDRIERNGRLKVLGVLRRRLIKSWHNHAECALRYTFCWRYPHESVEGQHYRNITAKITGLLRKHYPTSMAIKMLLRPLTLPHSLQRHVNSLGKIAQWWILR